MIRHRGIEGARQPPAVSRQPGTSRAATRRGGPPVSCFLSTVYWGRPAFTLVEVLVAIGILLILFNLLMVPMMMGLRFTSSTRRAVEAQDRARMAIEQMRKDVGRAMLVLPASPWETTSLANALPKGEVATMAVLDAAAFPASGLVIVGLVPFGAELISYTSRTATTLDGLTRGAGGSTATDHPPGSRVLLLTPITSSDEFTTSRLDLIMPKTDSQGRAIQPLTADPIIVRYYIAPVRRNVSIIEGWPKYWNPFQFPSVGVQPDRGTSPCFYVLYRVRFDLERLQNDPTYLLYGSDPWKVDFYDDARPSPVPFGAQAASYSFWWRKMSIALTPVESADVGLYVRMSPYAAAGLKGQARPGLNTREELRPLERLLPKPLPTDPDEWVAAPGFSILPARREREQLVPNDREEPTRYFGSLSLWSEWPAPTVFLHNPLLAPVETSLRYGEPATGAFVTLDLASGSLDFALTRKEYFDGFVDKDGDGVDDYGTPAGDAALIQDPDGTGNYNVYEVSLATLDVDGDTIPDFDRGGPTDALGNAIADFVILPGSEKIQVIDTSGNISDYTRTGEPAPAAIEENNYYINYKTGRITLNEDFNKPDPVTGLPPNDVDIIVQFQYRRNLVKDAGGNPVNDNVLATYSSLAMIDVRLNLASYSQSRVPTDEFRVASRLEVGNAPR